MIDGLDSEQQPYVVFAIDSDPAGIISDRTRQDWFEIWASTRGYAFKRLAGKWQGKDEVSYIMPADYEPQLWRTWCKGQEAILFLTAKVPYGNRQATLHYADGRQEAIGQWRQISAASAADNDHTFDPLTGTYWRAA